jgi:fatty acid desaturase
MKNELIYKNHNISIPSTLNLFLAFGSISLSIFLLYTVEHVGSLWLKIFSVLLFSYVGNTIFSLLHEAVHANFHHNRTINYLFGNICASMFPTAFSFQKRCHLNHHRNNRTQYELFEMYDDKDNKPVKIFTLYMVLTGLYWFVPFIGSVWLLISPKSLLNSRFSGKNNYEVGRMGGASMLRSFEKLSVKEIMIMRLEVLFTIFVQASLFYFLDLSFTSYILCYFLFGFTWSALQYADHAYSVRDIRNGAWNLKVHPITKAFFLNYHDHLAHHQHPNVPWIHLPKFVDPAEKKPEFWSIYLKMWRGLVKHNEAEPSPIDAELDNLIERENFTS